MTTSLKISEYNTIEQAIEDLSWQMLNNPEWPEGIRGTWNRRLWSTDHIVVIHEPKATLNLYEVDFKPQRWNLFLSSYIDSLRFKKFLEFIIHRKGNSAQEYGFIITTKPNHSLGSCLLGFTVRTGKKPRVTLYNRSSYLQPTAYLDLNFGALLCEYVSAVCLNRPCELIWYVSHMQTNCWKILPWLLNTGKDLETYVKGTSKEQQLYHEYMLIGWNKIVEGVDPNPKYQFYARMTKKLNKIRQRLQDNEPLPVFVPTLPLRFLPDEFIEKFNIREVELPDEDEDEEDDDDD